MKRIVVIFSGYNQRAVIAFLRTLNQNNISDYVIIASSAEDSIFHTKYEEKVIYTRKNKELCLEEIFYILSLVQEGNDKNECLIAPSTEALNRFLLAHRNELERRRCIIPLAEQSIYEDISDKESFARICRHRNISVPKEMKCINNFLVPFVAKPKKYFATDGRTYAPFIVKNQKEYFRFVKDYPKQDFIYQEYVEGTSHYLLFYFTRNGDYFLFSQENFAQQVGGKSIIAAQSSFLYKEKQVVNPYTDLFLDMQYHGFVMVELRKRENEYYMIEANPRFWGPSQLFCDAGYDFFEIFLHEYGILESYELNPVSATYLWNGGITGNLQETESCVWYGDGKEEVIRNLARYQSNDIYRRKDTINLYYKEKNDEDVIK